MDVFQLKCFLTVCETLNFARAAKKLNVSQPTITHQIQMLESELNVKLFNRSTRMVAITAEGKSFIPDAKNIIAIEAQAKMRFRFENENDITNITIGCANFAQLELLTNIIKKLRLEFPNLHPHLFVLPQDQLFQSLAVDRIDVIWNIYNENEVNSDIKYKELIQSDIVCVCAAEHKLADCEHITIDKLKSEHLIFCNPIKIEPTIAALQWKLMEGKSPEEIHFCTSHEEACVLAEAGLGISILPELFVSKNETLKKVVLADSPQLSCGIFYKNHFKNPVTNRFIHLCKEYFENYETIK